MMIASAELNARQIFQKAKYLIIIDHIYQFFDYPESLYLSNLNRSTFLLIRKTRQTAHIRSIKKQIQIHGKAMQKLLDADLCLREILKCTTTDNTIPSEVILEFFLYHILKYLSPTEFLLEKVSEECMIQQVFKYLPSNYALPYLEIGYHNSLGQSNAITLITNLLRGDLSHLTKLELFNCQLESTCIGMINKYLKSSSTLFFLDLRYNSLAMCKECGEIFETISKSQCIEFVYFSDNLFSKETIPGILSMSNSCNKLKEVNFERNVFTMEHIREFFGKEEFPVKECYTVLSFRGSLEYFVLNGMRGVRINDTNRFPSIMQPGIYYNVFAKDLNVQRFTISRCDSIQNVEGLVELICNSNPDIMHLNINLDLIRTEVVNASLQYIKSDKAKSLQSILVQGYPGRNTNRLNTFLKEVASSENIKNIKYWKILSISDKDQGLSHIATLLNQNLITRLYISNVEDIDKNNINSIAYALPNNTSLEVLIINYCKLEQETIDLMSQCLDKNQSLQLIRIDQMDKEELNKILTRNRKESVVMLKEFNIYLF